MRKEAIVTITAEGRDKGKRFKITEMSASRAEDWGIRAMLALAHSGVDIGDLDGTGMAGLAVLGVQALGKLDFYEAKPLLDEMFECVQFMPNEKDGNVVRQLIDDDIEEVATRLKLRAEVFQLHMGFSSAGSNSISESAPMTKQPRVVSSSTRIPPRRSAP